MMQKTYTIAMNITLRAENKQKALSMAGSWLEYWDDEKQDSNIDGVGGAEGYVDVREDL